VTAPPNQARLASLRDLSFLPLLSVIPPLTLRPTRYPARRRPALESFGQLQHFFILQRRTTISIASVFPVIFIISMAVDALSPNRAGWAGWPDLWFSIYLVVVAFMGLSWFIHVLRTRWLPLLSIISFVAFIVVVMSADWVVGTPCNWMGEESYATYRPSRSPIWSPPNPVACAADAEIGRAGGNIWRDFFSAGGGGGPTEEPVLRLNLSLMALRFFAFTAIPYFILRLISYLTACLSLGRTRTP
jgi:hypothetical protein